VNPQFLQAGESETVAARLRLALGG
jgi:hypothetical protein